MNFSFIRVAGFEITITFISLLVLAFYLILTVRVRLSSIMIFLALMMYALANGIVGNSDFEFYKSFAQFFLLALVVMMVGSLDLPDDWTIRRSHKLLIIFSVVIAVLLVSQFLLLNLFDSYLLTPMLGRFSSVGPGFEVYVPHELAIIKRPNAIFSEPSVAGWYMAFMVAVTSLYSMNIPSKVGLMLVFSAASVLTFSLSGILNTLIIWCSVGLIWSRSITPFILFFVAFGVVVGIIMYVGLGEFVVGRFSDINTQGSSVYYRLSAPMRLVSESLQMFPLGRPLGDIEFISSRSYMVNHESGSQTNIDNSFFLITYYFGVLGLFTTLGCIIFVGAQLIRKKTTAPVMVALFLALSQTGGLWSPGIIMLIGYTLVLSKYSVVEAYHR